MADTPDSDVKLVADAIRSTGWEDSHEDIARAVLGALAGAERLRADDSGIEVQLRAELAYTLERHDRADVPGERDWWMGGLRALERLAERLGIQLD